MAVITMSKAVNDAIREEMRRDKRVFIIGEGVRASYGAAGFIDEFGIDRIQDTAICENTILEASLGAALAGLRPIASMGFGAFLYVAANPVITDIARARFMFGGQRGASMVIIAANGAVGGGGSSHSDSVQAKFMNAPGLKMVVPSTAYDAKGLIKTAIRDDDPVLFLHHMMQGTSQGEVPDEEYLIPFGQAVVRTEGRGVTVVATLTMVQKAMNVAKELAAKNISVEVIDPRTLVPLDKEAILKSVAKTGRLVVMDESNKTCGVCSEISAMVCEEAFASLKAPVKRVAALDVPFGGSRFLENVVLPDERKLTQAIEEVMAYKA